jgi:tetratricopeptide (TPR) repeat protein
VSGKPSRDSYTRAEIRRHFKLRERQLQSWERQDLIPKADVFSFSDLIAIQTLVKLREKRVRAPRIGRVMNSLRGGLDGVKHPLSELRIVCDGRSIEVHEGGRKFEPLTGQTLFDFDAAELGAVKAFPEPKVTRNRFREAETWFQKGLDLEDAHAPIEDAIEAYNKAVELNPEAAGALVNLGTIYYRMRNFPEAEQHYVRAVAADPSYPLAEFNLGNLYDEQNRTQEAIEHYRRALRLDPKYADAHFNMALVRERVGESLQAVHHWLLYLKLDSSGKWADIARRQLERLRQETLIRTS